MSYYFGQKNVLNMGKQSKDIFFLYLKSLILLCEWIKKVIQSNSSYYEHSMEEICFDCESVFFN